MTIRCMDNLPEHVLCEILLLLPIKSLVCMRSVCKSWRSRISNPNFVELHMATTKANPINEYLIAYNKKRSAHQLSIINTNFLDRGISYLDFPLHLPKPCYIVGSCNGLLCVAYEKFSRQTLKRLYLWNPATRQVKRVHDYTNIKIDENIEIYNVSLGLCFDPSSGDYKVVRIVRGRFYADVQSPVEVYSLINNYWKEIKVKLNFDCFESFCPANVKGQVHWLVRQCGVIEQLALVSFDVKSENFCTISLPDSIMCHESTLPIGLFEFEESVAVVITDWKCQNEGISVWTLDDDSCWINKLIVRRPSQFTKIVGYLKTGEFVGTNFDRDVLLYDFANNVVKNTQLKLDTSGTSRACNYSESLVNLNYPSRSLPKKGKYRTEVKTRVFNRR